MFAIMWSYMLVIIVAVISAANAKSIQEDELERNVARNRPVLYYFYYGPGTDDPLEAGQFPEDGFNPEYPTVVLIHDRRGYFDDGFSRNVRSALYYSNRYDCNLFVMDWSFLAEGSYDNVVQNIDAAAQDLELFLEGLIINIPEVEPENIRLIGFGIGAHLAGIAGRFFRRTPIGQIIGLDPPGKRFSGVNTIRLSANDATYVEVIHTDGGLFGDGIGTAIGNVDFFVNGGSNQPGCLTSSCNHDYAYALYASSIQYPPIGYGCTSMTQVSLNTCRGRTMLLGGPEDKTPIIDGYYRVNAPKNPQRSITKEYVNQEN